MQKAVLQRTTRASAVIGDGHDPGSADRKARTYRPTAVIVIGRAATATLRLKLSQGARAAIRRALRSRRRVSAVLRVRVIDGAGNARTLQRTVALRLPARRSRARG